MKLKNLFIILVLPIFSFAGNTNSDMYGPLDPRIAVTPSEWLKAENLISPWNPITDPLDIYDSSKTKSESKKQESQKNKKKLTHEEHHEILHKRRLHFHTYTRNQIKTNNRTFLRALRSIKR